MPDALTGGDLLSKRALNFQFVLVRISRPLHGFEDIQKFSCLKYHFC